MKKSQTCIRPSIMTRLLRVHRLAGKLHWRLILVLWCALLDIGMNVIKEGPLKGAFTGFNGLGTAFLFGDGARWRQADATVHPCREFDPTAVVFLRRGRYYIQITGMVDLVEVVPDI